GASVGARARRRCRRAAIAPRGATVLAVVLSLVLAARPVDSTVSFHGRTIREAVKPLQGAISTVQAIPENLVFANLGLEVETVPIQGIVLTTGLILFWISRRWNGPFRAGPLGTRPSLTNPASALTWAFTPMEAAGAALVLSSYFIEWAFRGYLEYHNLRTLNLRAIVPWYDVIPQIGAVLFVTGWWSGPHRAAGLKPPRNRPIPLTRL